MTFQQFWQSLTPLYDAGEARAIARVIMERRFALSLSDIACGMVESIDEQSLTVVRDRLAGGEPVQYVIGEALFCGRYFHVGPGVLIPRPETEWLCWKAIELLKGASRGSVLDIGTGSGCIACTLALDLNRDHEIVTEGSRREIEVTAWDISEQALDMARHNAGILKASVNVEKADALNPPLDSRRWDVIVSNPPYICQCERTAMHTNVVGHEPELALFVPDDDPLLFYRAITRYAINTLKPGGALLFELNPAHAEEFRSMAMAMGASHVAIERDDYGKDRYAIVR